LKSNPTIKPFLDNIAGLLAKDFLARRQNMQRRPLSLRAAIRRAAEKRRYATMGEAKLGRLKRAS